MKGFTKGKGKGKKFIPTSKNKSSLSKSDIKKRDTRKMGELAGFQDILINKSLDAGDKTVGNPLFAESVKETSKSKGKSALNFIVKATGESIKKQKKAQDEKKKREREIREDQERIESINQDVIDDIVDNRTTTNEQKFRFLQRYAVENNESLTDRQRAFVNNTLMRLEKEGATPETFIGSSASKPSSSSSSNRSRNETMQPRIEPIKLMSGRMATPTQDENALNQFASQNTNRFVPTPITEQPVTTTTTTTSPAFPSNLNDNLNAEINAVVGR